MLSPDEASFLDAWASCSDNADWPMSATNSSASSSVPHCDHQPADNSRGRKGASWSRDEHERFLEAMHLYPTGPWSAIAAYIGTRSSRQARTHAQKLKEKLRRRQRKLQRMQSYLSADVDSSTTTRAADANGTLRFCRQGIPWTPAEQERLREALEMHQQGPWRAIAEHVRTRSIRQVMAYTHKRRQVLASPSSRLTSDAREAEAAIGELERLEASELNCIGDLVAHDFPHPRHESDADDLLNRLLFDDFRLEEAIGMDGMELPNLSGGYDSFTPI